MWFFSLGGCGCASGVDVGASVGVATGEGGIGDGDGPGEGDGEGDGDGLGAELMLGRTMLKFASDQESGERNLIKSLRPSGRAGDIRDGHWKS